MGNTIFLEPHCWFPLALDVRQLDWSRPSQFLTLPTLTLLSTPPGAQRALYCLSPGLGWLEKARWQPSALPAEFLEVRDLYVIVTSRKASENFSLNWHILGSQLKLTQKPRPVSDSSLLRCRAACDFWGFPGALKANTSKVFLVFKF